MDAFYGNQLKKYISDPSSFNGSPGFNFALQTGLDGIDRKMAAGGFSGSGNALAELTKYGTGLASQEYGNTIDRRGKLAGQEQNYDIGLGQNANTATRNMNDFAIGAQRNTNDAQKNWWDYDVNQTRNSNDFTLGQGRNAIDWFNAGTNRGTAQSNSWNNGNKTELDWARYYNPYPSGVKG